MADPIPSFYRIWFTIIDPIVALIGSLGNILMPASTLQSYSASFANPPAAETIALLDIMAGFLASLIVLQVFLLRARPMDLTVWRSFQAAVVLVDFTMLGAIARSLIAQGRVDWRVWTKDELVYWGFTAVIAAIRTSFLLGIGMGRQGKGKRA